MRARSKTARIPACFLLAACHAGGPPPEPAQIPPPASAPAEPEPERTAQDAPDAPAVSSAEPLGEKSAPHQVTSTCHEPLATFCKENPCATFTDARTRAETSAQGYNPALCTGMCAGEVHVGDCGELRWVQDGDCLCGTTRYFDAGGKLVGANRWSDYQGFCRHTSFTVQYGRVPSGCP